MKDFLGDNAVLSVNGRSLERLKYAMQLGSGFPSYGYRIHGPRMCFARYESAPEMIKFPAPLGPERCAELAFDWLQTVSYPPQPDHDGDNEEGWLLRTDDWGHINGLGYQYFLAVEPQWIMFGK